MPQNDIDGFAKTILAADHVYITAAGTAFYACLAGKFQITKFGGPYIEGILLITGYSNKAERKFVKVLASSLKAYQQLFLFLFYNYNVQLFLQIKRNSPLFQVARQYKFEIFGDRGEELLLCKKPYVKKGKQNYGYRSDK